MTNKDEKKYNLKKTILNHVCFLGFKCQQSDSKKRTDNNHTWNGSFIKGSHALLLDDHAESSAHVLILLLATLNLQSKIKLCKERSIGN